MESLPLQLCHVHKVSAIFNRSFVFVHSIALIALIYYRVTYLFHENIPTIPWLLVFASELILSFLWLLNQAYRWSPVSRTALPERLPEDKQLPAIDVFVCTADPNREPILDVMNTVISAMAMDYPPEKLYVYVSDDGGSSVTLEAMREAWVFASLWLPFCRTFGVKTGCPEAYFNDSDKSDNFQRSDFIEERHKIKAKYHDFKERIMRITEIGKNGGTNIPVNRDHSPVVEIIRQGSTSRVAENREMPLLVYISREKRPSHTHNFKAGALNALLRVSGMISNSPYILSLDCDMYCHDNSSARQAMCFHLDPKISESLAFVQFPQRFLKISDNDIYDSHWRSFSMALHGMDGLEGPVLCGTGFYIKRKVFYGSFIQEDIDEKQLNQVFGPSNEFIKSLDQHYMPNTTNGGESSTMLQEARLLASCSFEKHTKWGEEVGFLYYCVVEDVLTGFTFHCKGWTSVYCNPSIPQFMGSVTTNLNDVLVQGSRWSTGLLDVAFSKFCPLIYGPLRLMSILESMCYFQLATLPLFCLPLWCLAVVPQLCLLNGIPLYPEVSNSYFPVIAFIFLSSHIKHLQEVFSTGGSIQALWNEERIWMIKSVTCYLYGTLDFVMKKMGMREANFIPTNKVVDSEQVQLYKMGKLNFQTSNMFLVPLVTLVLLNIFSLVGGVARMIISKSPGKLFAQVFMSFYIVILSYPILEGMIVRKDKGRIPCSATLLSAAVSMIFLSLFTTNWLDGSSFHNFKIGI